MTGRSLRELPKAHLHLHLDGALRPSTYAELGGPEVPHGYTSFAAFGTAIETAAGLLGTAAVTARVVDEIVQDAEADGAVWVELSLWPGLFRGRLGSHADALEVVLAAGRSAAAAHGVGFGVVVAANRDRGPEEAVATARLAAAYATDGVVGFGLDGNEVAAPGRLFADAFGVARDAGLTAVPHAGETAGPESVRDAVDVLRADRIMHGVRAVEDEAVLARLGETVLDVCPTSNAMLSVVPSLEEHPLKLLLAKGIRCSINADDPLLFRTGLLAEYEVARHRIGLTDDELAACARTSVEHSAAPPDVVRRALAGIDDWVTAGQTTALASGGWFGEGPVLDE